MAASADVRKAPHAVVEQANEVLRSHRQLADLLKPSESSLLRLVRRERLEREDVEAIAKLGPEFDDSLRQFRISAERLDLDDLAALYVQAPVSAERDALHAALETASTLARDIGKKESELRAAEPERRVMQAAGLEVEAAWHTRRSSRARTPRGRRRADLQLVATLASIEERGIERKSKAARDSGAVDVPRGEPAGFRYAVLKLLGGHFRKFDKNTLDSLEIELRRECEQLKAAAKEQATRARVAASSSGGSRRVGRRTGAREKAEALLQKLIERDDFSIPSLRALADRVGCDESSIRGLPKWKEYDIRRRAQQAVELESDTDKLIQ